MKVSEIGERKLIEILLNLLSKDPEELFGYDDVSGRVLLGELIFSLKTDTFVASTDLLPGTPWKSVGRKIVVMNISDFAAKGITPLAGLISLCLKGDMELRDVKEIYKGINETAKEYKVPIWGGDTNECSDLVITGAFAGIGLKSKLVFRSGAKPGDLIYSTGEFGLTSAAFKILLGKREVEDKKLRKKILKSVYEPKAKLKEGLTLTEKRLVNASIDCSDGLAASLNELARQSRVNILVEKIPVAKEAKKYFETQNLDPEKEALYQGGEEYELILTIPPEKIEEAKSNIEKTGSKLFYIGKVKKGRGVYLIRNGEKEVIEDRGWQHFLKWKRKFNVPSKT